MITTRNAFNNYHFKFPSYTTNKVIASLNKIN